MNQQHHFFVSSWDVWVTDADLNLALKRFWEATGTDSGLVYLVPLPPEATYDISMYQPKVDDLVFLDRVFKTRSARDKAERDGTYSEVREHHAKWGVCNYDKEEAGDAAR